ncbi:MAG: hypothetical protein JXR73_19550 [Candidatus Omnitrophica bacterium]|nr:hypothetical protein [Candidatus Omnitrophota bacterium]
MSMRYGILLLLLFGANTAVLAQSSFEAGLAEEDVTPAIGMEMPGGYGKAFHKQIHDPCKVRVSVFHDGKKKIALVSVDALMIPRRLTVEARKEILDKCGIRPEAVLIGASHSHSSGPVGMVQPGQYDFASPFVQKLAYQESSCADSLYLNQVKSAIVKAVCQADKRLAPVFCGAGKGSEDQVAYNRRFHMKNGWVYTHPGKGNPDILSVAGPTDPEVGVIGVWDQQDVFLGCIVNYACHATTSPPGASANWIYYMEKAIRGCLGENAIVVFLQGFSGDVTQVDNLSPYANPSGDEWAQIVGGRVGAEAVKVLLSMEKGTLQPLESQSVSVPCRHRVPDPDRVKRCYELVREAPTNETRTDWTFAKEIVLLDALLSQKSETEVEVQAIQIGPVVLLTTPGEMFCQYGLDLKEKSPFPLTFPVELANGCVGYVPTLEALGDHGGGYETRLTSYSHLEANAGNVMMERLLKMASDMSPGTAPSPEPAPAFRNPWSYGSAPPELK